jgi:hypothetical protein
MQMLPPAGTRAGPPQRSGPTLPSAILAQRAANNLSKICARWWKSPKERVKNSWHSFCIKGFVADLWNS